MKLKPPVAPFRLQSCILLNALFSKALRTFHSLNVKDQILYPYKTTDEIIIL